MMASVKTIAIEYRPGEIRAAAIDVNGEVIEFQVERTHDRSLVGGIYVGRVLAVRDEIGAAFVDIGVGRDAFLNLHRIKKTDDRHQDSLGTVIVEGAAILVRVDRDAELDKGARLTTKVDPLEIPDNLKCPSILFEPPNLVVRVIRGWSGPDTERVIVDEARVAADVRAHILDDVPEIVVLHNGQSFDEMGIADVFEAQLSPNVLLPNGGMIILERTSAMTTIDVNVRQGMEGNLERAALQTNMEAVHAIARALRLRNIGGLIAVDFLKMSSKADNEITISALREALADDPVQAETSKMSGFGIVEIARRQISASISEMFLQTQSVPSPSTLALEALNDIRKRRGTSATITGSHDVIAALKGPLKDAKVALESELGFVIQLETSPDSGNVKYTVT